MSSILFQLKRLRGSSAREVLRYGVRKVAGHTYLCIRRPQDPDTSFHKSLKHLDPAKINQGTDALIKSPLDESQLDAIVGTINQRYPEHLKKVLKTAHQIVEGRLSILGFGEYFFKKPIDWQLDRISGHRWPLKHYLAIPHVYPGTEIKFLWEVSRAHHWVTLGQAFRYTGDETFAQECVEQWKNWLDSNPYPFGGNWLRAMEVAIRAVNWLWTFALIKEFEGLSPELALRIIGSLAEHGHYIEKNLENRRAVSNHYVANGIGLLYLGCLLPGARASSRWRDLGARILWSQILFQVYEEGTSYERSTAYHRLSLEFFMAGVLIARKFGVSVPREVMDRLEAMFGVLDGFVDNGGRFPLIGDNDSGALLRFGLQPSEKAHHLLKVGAVLFNRNDWARWADVGVDALYYIGETASSRYDQLRKEKRPPISKAALYPKAGWFFMRTRDTHLSFCIGPSQQRGPIGGVGRHGHNDNFSITFSINGLPVIVDPGTFCYSYNTQMRRKFVSSLCHNTLTIDGEEVNTPFEVCPPYFLLNAARPKILHAGASNGLFGITAEHYGYHRLTDPVTVRRTVLANIEQPYFYIIDEIIASGQHLAEAYFQFATGIETTALEHLNGWRLITQTKHDVLICAYPLNPKKMNIHVMFSEGKVAPRYGKHEPAPALKFRYNTVGRTRVGLLLLPIASNAPEPHVESLSDFLDTGML